MVPEGEYALGNLIYFGPGICIEFLKLLVQVKKVAPLNVPVEIPELLVVQMIIRQKRVQFHYNR
jgi:hypothetical protein